MDWSTKFSRPIRHSGLIFNYLPGSTTVEGLEGMDFSDIELEHTRIRLHGRVYQWAARQFNPGWVIDVGSELGFGIGLMQAENSRLSILGCDLDASVLKIASGFTWSTSHENVQADGARLPIADEALTGVCLMNILHLVENPHLLIDETQRTLKRAGKVMVYVDLSKLPLRWEPQQFGPHMDALLREKFHITEIEDPYRMDPDLFSFNQPPWDDVYLRLGEKN